MAMVKVPGLAKSEGMKGGAFTPYVDGEYALEITAADTEEKTSDKGTGTSFKFSFAILEGPDQEDGKSPDGRKFTHFIYIMNEDHNSYEEWGHIGVDELESLRMAANVAKKGNAIDPQDFVGQKVRALLGTETEKREGKYQGQTRNKVREWRSYK